MRSSYHTPIYLISDSRDLGPKFFRAFDVWLRDEKMQEINGIIFHHKASWFGLLKEVKMTIKKWLRE